MELHNQKHSNNQKRYADLNFELAILKFLLCFPKQTWNAKIDAPFCDVVRVFKGE